MQKPVRALTVLLTIALLMAATLGVANSQAANGKYDTDGDGLIEVSNLEQLDAIRQDLDGDGKTDHRYSDHAAYAAAFPVSGTETVCNANCKGYELARSLDFDKADSYASGAVNTGWTTGNGWKPIAHIASFASPSTLFRATFNGNGHTISNLYINPTTQAAGLFGGADRSVIREIGLVNADVTGVHGVGGLVGINYGTISDSYVTGSVSGYRRVGGLVGENGGTISDSYATGSVSAPTSDDSEYVGGLVGFNGGTISDSYATGSVSVSALRFSQSVGGLAGLNQGTIIASYATGSVTRGFFHVGGLVGNNSDTIIASYATGSVSGESNVGGLVGNNSDTIIASYATGSVSGESNVGGLVGYNHKVSPIIASFWDTQTSGQTTGAESGDSAGVEGKTTAELQAPTSYTGIYRGWSADLDNADGDDNSATGTDDFWDFGTNSQYPVLKVDFDGDGAATWQEFGRQRPNSPPEFPDAEAGARSVAENTAAGESIGGPGCGHGRRQRPIDLHAGRRRCRVFRRRGILRAVEDESRTGLRETGQLLRSRVGPRWQECQTQR